MRTHLAAASVLVMLAACSQPKSDAPAPARPVSAPMIEASGGAAAGSLDDFVAKAAAGDMYEVEAGKIAEAQAQSAPVRDLAKMMQADHIEATANLKEALIAAGSSVTPPPALPSDKQALLDALNAAPAGQFDRVYLDQQEIAHQAALALMKSYVDHGDIPQVKAFASQVTPVFQAHLDTIKTLKAGK